MREHRHNPPVLKRYGQHFLTDRAVLSDIVSAIAPTKDDTVVEIGPGRGILTDELANRARRLVAVEIDRALATALRERYAANPEVEIVNADILDTPMSRLATPPYLVVGNVPYYITTPILFHVLQPPLPTRAVFLVQREVAERIVAAPGSRDYGALSVNVQAIASAEIVRRVPAAAFRPAPRVESAVIRITPLASPIIPLEGLPGFREFVQATFGMRRKQMVNVIRGVTRMSAHEAEAVLEENRISPQARGETLAVEQFKAIADAIETRRR